MHSFVSCLLHVVFSTKDRRPSMTPQMQEKLWPYLGGIARNNKMKTMKVGGVEDHVHILPSSPATLEIAKAVQHLKGNSSKWIHETFPDQQSFDRYRADADLKALAELRASAIRQTIVWVGKDLPAFA